MHNRLFVEAEIEGRVLGPGDEQVLVVAIIVVGDKNILAAAIYPSDKTDQTDNNKAPPIFSILNRHILALRDRRKNWISERRRVASHPAQAPSDPSG